MSATSGAGPTNSEARPLMEIDPRLLESLVCPLTHGPLQYDREHGELISRKAALAFPIRDGVPIMLRSEARQVND